MSKLIEGLKQYFEETDKESLDRDLANLEKYNQFGPLVDMRLEEYSQQRLDAYDYLLKSVTYADKENSHILLKGHFGGAEMGIVAIRLSPKGECKEEVRDLEILCDDMVWHDNILREIDIFPTRVLYSMSANLAHGNCVYVSNKN